MMTNTTSSEQQIEPQKKRRGRPPLPDSMSRNSERTKSYRDRLNAKAARESKDGVLNEVVQLNAVVLGQTREQLKMCAKQNNMTIGELLNHLVEKSDLTAIFEVK
ncbi:hypothetical protein [uncultured Deefgea sp.]|uniref:hypothetical protein n=1 Tax=uncultured Deefgea sp. TaxID=1304914 RepID=UPI002619A7AF|nr:hypothetical protein [uncultured Deefgea sp.]